jgi:hypothetical protein
MDGYWLLVLHAVGDYWLQSDWMAQEKTKGSWPAIAHALTYTLPFVLLFGLQWQPLLLIGGTHFIIDRWRLARYICWAKNFLSPKGYWPCTYRGVQRSSPADGNKKAAKKTAAGLVLAALTGTP